MADLHNIARPNRMVDILVRTWQPCWRNNEESNIAEHAWSTLYAWAESFGMGFGGMPDAFAWTNRSDCYAFRLDTEKASVVILAQIDPDGAPDGHDSVEWVEVQHRG